MAEMNQLDVSTRRYIRENPSLVDSVFQADPVLAYLKQNVREDFGGGSLIQENFYYDGMIGGSYQKGKQFDITEKQVEQGCQFNMKFFEVNVTLSLEDMEVLNTGPLAAFRLVDSRMTNAYLTMGAFQGIAIYLPGTGAGYTPNYNGLAEALNDNSTASWNGATYPTYGGITRGGSVGTSLNSIPTNVNGAIQYSTLENTYGNASFGNIEPNLGATTRKGLAYIKEKFQTQQRFNDTQDPKIGFNGLKFNSATVIATRYAPGTYISGSGDPNAVTYLTQMSNGAITVYPTVSAETLWWINARKPFFNFYVSKAPKYAYGFTGWKPAQGNTKVAGQVLSATAMTLNPRYHAQLYGITG